MVLPGADRESEDNNNSNYDSGASRSNSNNKSDGSNPTRFYPDRRLINPKANNYQPDLANQADQPRAFSPEQRRMQQLASPDISQLDMDALLSKQLSVWKYVNPAYPKWFSLSLGLQMATTQVTINRELSENELRQYADALTVSNSAGTFYKRLILWPATIAILAYSRGRKPVPSAMAGRVASPFSIHRPVNQFVLAYVAASLVEGYGYRSEYDSQMQDSRLQGLNRELKEITRARFGAPGTTASRSGVGQDRQGHLQDQTRVADDAMAKFEDTNDWYNQMKPSPQSRAATETSGADPWQSFNSEPSTYDDASPTAPIQNENKPGSAWDRIRQRGATKANDLSSGNGAFSETAGQSFSFSAEDQDQQLAKNEAQAEFDARIERERQGKDFSNESGGRQW